MKPMLASKLDDPTKLNYPVLASPRLYGVRCLITNGSPLIDGHKIIKNSAIRQILNGLPPMDGVITVGDPRDSNCREETLGWLAEADTVPKFMFWVFDAITVTPMPFKERIDLAKFYANSSGRTVGLVANREIKSAKAFLSYVSVQQRDGFDSVMVRDPAGPYKQGCATVREGYLLEFAER